MLVYIFNNIVSLKQKNEWDLCLMVLYFLGYKQLISQDCSMKLVTGQRGDGSGQCPWVYRDQYDCSGHEPSADEILIVCNDNN